MYARSTMIHGKPENIDAGIRFVENEVRPMLEDLPGCKGLSLLVDRDSGRCIATSSWDTEESMRASDERLRPFRERARDLFQGAMEVDEWEIGLMHRMQHGECCRVTWVQGDDLDRARETFKMGVLPEAEALEGFCGASLLMNRSTGIACTTTAWADRDAMEASRMRADELRQRASSEASLEILEVAEFDLVIAHLHVPELV